MNSCLYQGVLRHRRLQPKAHHFVYRLFMAWLDLDELDRLPEAGIRRNRLAAAACAVMLGGVDVSHNYSISVSRTYCHLPLR